MIIGKALGYKSQQSTTIYARLNLDAVRPSINQATKAMIDVIQKDTKKSNDNVLSPVFNQLKVKQVNFLNFI